VKEEADGKVHIEDPNHEIKQLGGEKKGNSDSGAAAMKLDDPAVHGGAQGAPAAHEATKEKAAEQGSEWS
jgi:hypothetical protein